MLRPSLLIDTQILMLPLLRSHTPSLPLLTLLVLTGAALVYWPGISGPFIVDDIPNITVPLAEINDTDDILNATLTNHSGPTGRPLSVLSFALNSYFSGIESAAPFKLTNLAIHLATGILLLLFSIRLFRTTHPDIPSGYIHLASLLAMSAWLLHPLLVSTTLYTVQRMTQLAALFTVAALLLYMYARQRIVARPIIANTCLFLGIPALAIAALLSKENGALIPFYILALEVFIFRFQAYTTRERRILITCILLLSITPCINGLFYFITHFNELMSGYDVRPFSIVDRARTEVVALAFYLKLIILPRLSSLTLFHDDFPIYNSWTTDVILSGVLLCTLALVALKIRTRYPVVSFGIAVYFISHLLESTVLPLEPVFEHRNYLATYGITLSLSALLLGRRPQATHRKRLAAILTLVTVSLATLTSARVSYWTSTERLISISAYEHPESTRALTELANIHIKHGDLISARLYLMQAASLSPMNPGVPLHIMATYCGSTEGIPLNVIEAATTRLREGTLTAYAEDSISSLISLVKNNKCPSVSPDLLASLTEAGLENTRRPNRPSMLLYHARALVLSGHPEEALPYYNRATETKSAHLRLIALDETTQVLISLNRPLDAYNKIQLIKAIELESLISTQKRANKLTLLLSEALKNAGLLDSTQHTEPP